MPQCVLFLDDDLLICGVKQIYVKNPQLSQLRWYSDVTTAPPGRFDCNDASGLIAELDSSQRNLTGKRPISKKFANGRPVYHMTFVITSCIQCHTVRQLRLFINDLLA